MEFHKYMINDQEKQDMSFIMYHEPNGIIAAIFASMPLKLKQHCIKVGTVAGIMSEYVPSSLIPKGMTHSDYSNAIRYGGFYHDIGAYLTYNDWLRYPSEGKKILEKEISVKKIANPIRTVILETVGYYEERYDGKGSPQKLCGRQIPFHSGVCAIANAMDNNVSFNRSFSDRIMIGIEKYIKLNEGIIFTPEAVAGFMAARHKIRNMYYIWEENPPLWKRTDLNPVQKPYKKTT